MVLIAWGEGKPSGQRHWSIIAQVDRIKGSDKVVFLAQLLLRAPAPRGFLNKTACERIDCKASFHQVRGHGVTTQHWRAVGGTSGHTWASGKGVAWSSSEMVVVVVVTLTGRPVAAVELLLMLLVLQFRLSVIVNV